VFAGDGNGSKVGDSECIDNNMLEGGGVSVLRGTSEGRGAQCRESSELEVPVSDSNLNLNPIGGRILGFIWSRNRSRPEKRIIVLIWELGQRFQVASMPRGQTRNQIKLKRWMLVEGVAGLPRCKTR